MIDYSSDLILLKSRFSRLEKNNQLGLLSSSEESIERNRIVSAALSLAGIEASSTPKNQPITVVIGDINEAALLQIIKDNRRRREGIAKQASDILADYRTWKDTKTTTPTYDPANRRILLVSIR